MIPPTRQRSHKIRIILKKKTLDNINNIIYESKNYNNYNIIIISFKHRGYDYYVLVIINNSTNNTNISRGFRWSTLSKGNSLSYEHLDFFSQAVKHVSLDYVKILKSAVLNKQYAYEAKKILKGGLVLGLTVIRGLIGFLLSWIQMTLEIDLEWKGLGRWKKKTIEFYDNRKSDPSEQRKYRINTLIRQIEEIIKKLENHSLDVEEFITRFFQKLIELSDIHKKGIDITADAVIRQINAKMAGGYRENPKRKKRKNTMRKKKRDTRRKKRKNTKRNKRKNTKRKSSKRE